MGLKQTILEILKAFNNCKVEYEPYILNPLDIFLQTKQRMQGYVLCTYQNKEESIRSITRWTDTRFVYSEIE